MALLIVGLVLFLGVHSVRIVAEDTRNRFIEQRGEGAWKGLYVVVSLIGFVLLVIGYGQARQAPVFLWAPPAFLTHINWLLMLVAFILLAAAYVPGNGLRVAVGHPMVLGVKVWAFAHLLVNGTLADLVLFGSFLVWAIVDYVACRRRDRRLGTVRVATGGVVALIMTVVAGAVGWAVFALWAHRVLIGVSPLGSLGS